MLVLVWKKENKNKEQENYGKINNVMVAAWHILRISLHVTSVKSNMQIDSVYNSPPINLIR